MAQSTMSADYHYTYNTIHAVLYTDLTLFLLKLMNLNSPDCYP